MSQSILSLKAVISEKKQNQKQRSDLPKKRKEKDDVSHKETSEEDEEEQRRMLVMQKKSKLYDALKSSAGSSLHIPKDFLLVDISRNDKKEETKEEIAEYEVIIDRIKAKQADFMDKYSQSNAYLRNETGDDFINTRDYYEKAALQMSLKHVLAEVDLKPPMEPVSTLNDRNVINSHENISQYIPSNSDDLGRVRPTGHVIDQRKELLLQKKKQLNNKLP